MKHLLSILCLFVLSCDTAAHIIGISRSDHSHSCEDGAEFTESGYYCDDWEFIEEFYNCNGDECTDAYVSNLNSFSYQQNEPSNYISWFNGRITEILINSGDFESIPESIGNLDYLTKLTFTNTKISELPDEIVLLPFLEQLWISNNLLTNLPDDIGELSNLKLLFINNNQITKLPDSIVNLEQLIYHNFSYNLLTELPDNINFIFQNTESSNSAYGYPDVINFSHNKLTILPESFFDLNNIRSIDLSYNELTTLSESICNLSTSCYVYVSNNYLCDVYHYDCINDIIDILWGSQDQSNCCEGPNGEPNWTTCP